MRRALTSTASLVLEAYREWREDRAIRLGAGLAYYGLFAIVPLVSLSILVAGLVFSQEEIRSFLADQLDTLLDLDLDTVSVDLAEQVGATSTLTSLGIVGVASALLSASLVFVALQDAFNVIFDLPVQVGMQYTIRRRLLSFLVVLLLGALLIGALVIQAIAPLLRALVPDVAVLETFDSVLVSLASWAVGIGVLAVLFHLLIRTALGWRDTLVASAITGVFLVAGTWAFGLYFRNFATTSVTGVAADVLLVLLWIYVQAQIVMGGTELLKVLHRRHDDDPTGVSEGQ